MEQCDAEVVVGGVSSGCYCTAPEDPVRLHLPRVRYVWMQGLLERLLPRTDDARRDEGQEAGQGVPLRD